MGHLPKIEDFSDDFDPFEAFYSSTGGGEGISGAVEQLATLARKGPVIEADLHESVGLKRQANMVGDTTKSMLALTFAACQEALGDGATYSSAINERHIGLSFGTSVSFMDAPIHTRYRRLFQAAFTPNALAAYRASFENVVHGLIDDLMPDLKGDLVAQFARQFPFSFIYNLLGMPVSDRKIFHKLSVAQTAVIFDPAHGIEAGEKLGRYLTALIEERRKLKSDKDFVSVLANAEVDGERLPHDVLLGFFRQLLSAGGDTSYHSFSNIMAGLFTQPDQIRLLRENRALIPQAIEEGVRWGNPLGALDRILTRDGVLAGIPLEKGTIVRVCISTANQDERVWDNPHKFDIMRERKRHLAFGYGPHVCIGQHLAKMELEIALNALLDRLPNVRLDPDMPPPVIRGLLFRGADAVHVKWDI